MAQLVAAFVTSHLDYCNGVLAGLPQSTLSPLQRVQNVAARPYNYRVQQTCEMTSCSNLHSSVNNTYVKSRTRTKFAERAFSLAGRLVWNALSTELRTIKCNVTLKHRRQSCLFGRVPKRYSSCCCDRFRKMSKALLIRNG